jgi:hypothetical protein
MTGHELFRRGTRQSFTAFVIAEAPLDGELDFITTGRNEETWIRLDPFEVRDLVAALTAWAADHPAPTGPRERR